MAKRRNVRRSYARRRRRSVLRVYLALTLVCGLVAIVWVFATGIGPKMIREAITKQVQTTIAEEGEKLKKQLKKDLSGEDVEGLKEKYKKYMDR